MRLNGNLVLNPNGQSEIQNVVLERVASLPTTSAAEAGRVVFLTTTGTYYFNNAGTWTAFATGGNAAALQTEVDNVEAALGSIVDASGVWSNAALSATSMSGASNLTAALVALDSAVKGKDQLAELTDVQLGTLASGNVLRYNGTKWENSTALTDEVTRATAAEAALAADLAAEVTNRTADVNAEETRALAAEAALQAALDAETTARIAGDATAASNLAAQLAAEQTARIAGDATLTAALATEETARIAGDAAEAASRAAADTALQNALIAEETNRSAADTALQNALNSEITARQNADAGFAADLAAEVTARSAADLIHTNDISARVKLAGDTMSGDLDFNALYTVKGLRAPSLANDAATKDYVDTVAAGLTWKNSAKAATTGNITLSGEQTVDGVAVVAGDRVLVLAQAVPAENGIYVVASGSWTRASDADTTAELANAALFVQEGSTWGDTAWVQTQNVATVGTSNVSFSQFSGGSVVTPGTGLSQSGSVLNINLGAGIAELPSDEVGVDLFAGGGLFLTVDGTNADSTNAAQVAVKLDGSTLTRTAAGVKVSDATIARISTLETDLATETTTRGAADALNAANILVEQTARQAADALLQSNLDIETTARINADAALQAALDAETTARQAAASGIQTELDATQAGAGLTTAGGYIVNGSANYIGSASSLAGADNALDTALKAEEVARVAADSTLTTNLAAEVTNRTAAVAGVQAAVDAEVTNRTAAVAGVQTAINNGYYLHDQSSASTTWTVTHNIGSKYCNVTVVDGSDEVIIPQSITFNSTTGLTVAFNVAITGKVIVMGKYVA